MRSRRRQLELEVVRAARAFAHSPVRSGAAGHLLAIIDAVKAMDALDPPPITGAGAPHAAGSETSLAAARLAYPTQRSVRRAIIAYVANVPPLAHPGYTDEQLERRLSRSHQTVSSARNWLCEQGWLEDSGVRRQTGGRRQATVWQLTDAGKRQLATGEPA